MRDVDKELAEIRNAIEAHKTLYRSQMDEESQAAQFALEALGRVERELKERVDDLEELRRRVELFADRAATQARARDYGRT